MKRAFGRFKKFAERVANIQAKIIMSVIFILLIIPLSWIIKIVLKKRMLFYKDENAATYWTERYKIPQTLEWARKQ